MKFSDKSIVFSIVLLVFSLGLNIYFFVYYNTGSNVSFNGSTDNILINDEPNIEDQKNQITFLLSDRLDSTVNKNIIAGLESQADIFPVEIPQLLSSDLFFQFIESEEQCESITGNFAIDGIKKECRYDFYLRKLLENRGEYEVPSDLLGNNTFLDKILARECIFGSDYACMLLPYNDFIPTRSEFLDQTSQYLKENNLSLEEVPFHTYGYYLFESPLESIRTEVDSGNIYYDKALVYLAVYDNNQETCTQVITEPFKSYCNDLFQENNNYEEIFTSFYSGFQQ